MNPRGALRSKVSANDLSFHISYGTLPTPLTTLEYNFDIGKTLPDQNGDGYPMACRGYTLADIAGDEDDAIYKHQHTYDALSAYEGHSISQGGDIRSAVNFGCVMGVQRLDETTDQEAESHRRGQPFVIDKLMDFDWFDSFRAALRNAQSPISVGTIYFPEWLNTASDGILTSQFVFDGTWDTEMGHNYKICGEKTIQGQPYLIAKTWQGPNFGDRGFCYFSRETFNKAFDIYGTIGIVQPKYSPKDVYYVRLEILQRIVVLISRYISSTLAAKLKWNYA